jgi:hypothetical protein
VLIESVCSLLDLLARYPFVHADDRFLIQILTAALDDRDYDFHIFNDGRVTRHLRLKIYLVTLDLEDAGVQFVLHAGFYRDVSMSFSWYKMI